MAKQTGSKPGSGVPPLGNVNVTLPAGETERAAGNGTPGPETAGAGTSGAANGQAAGSAGNGAESSAATGNENAGQATTGNETNQPDSGAKPGDDQTKPDSGAPPRGKGNDTGKKKIRHSGKAGKRLIVGSRLIQFDAEGVTELDEAEAAMLLGLNCGYEEA